MKSRTNTICVLVLGTLLILVCACEDSPSKVEPGKDSSSPSNQAALNMPVKSSGIEGVLATTLFHGPTKKAIVPLQDALIADGYVPKRIIKSIREISLSTSQDFLGSANARLTERSGESADGNGWASLRLRGSNSSRRLILTHCIENRGVMPGPGARAMELVCLPEVLGVFVQLASKEGGSELPFDLEILLLQKPDPSLEVLKETVEGGVNILGVICVEELASVKPGSTNLFVELIQGERSTLRSAVHGAGIDIYNDEKILRSVTFSEGLPKPSASLASHFQQDLLPVVALRVASSSPERTPKPLTRGPKRFRRNASFDKHHTLVGTPEDRLEKVCDKDFAASVAVQRVLLYVISRIGVTVA